LVQQVESGHIKVEDIRSAFMMRALDVAVESNYLADLCDSKPEQNKSLDHFEADSKHSLIGLHFSVPDWLPLSNYDCTLGLSSRCFKP